ncbi:CENP-Q, a CENPA-CAD centromere complex subunit-domain-containing protein [Annulohypoxylon truncatum]|uniref:CENP-Q, a CENPA-CAD centromere complex subunit-domain-containing protein n=1 Tax=Annulohypoxylon truncatum TaxID=327061 RepID=UPI00200780DA|nr:CENP-Q, a CENPA-CAD centromere complex subunit-domain-containing protein [Annulohypoxylon truncatum]KAI1214473.1 CENP-Q, a CENPA-CAD centromere complex subunit-domain-containing protein [Annulohypoxylon truncatum]
MAPEAANQKRKRGRPTNASRDDEDASGTQPSLTGQGQLATTSENTREMDESSRPRKRGRRANAEPLSQAQPEPEASRPEKAKRKRGPSPTAPQDGNEEAAGNEGLETANPQRKKRGRPRVSNESVEEPPQSNVAAENAAPKKRGRPKASEASKGNEPEADEADDENEGNSSLLRRSGRVRRSPGSSNKGAQEVTSDQPPKGQKPKKRGRPSLTSTQHPAEETEQEPVPQPKKKRGRPSLNNQPTEDTEAASASQKQSKKRARPPSSGEGASTSTKENGRKRRDQPPREQPDSGQEDSQPAQGRPARTSPRNRQHRRSSDTQNRSSSANSDSETSAPKYRHLTTRTRRIPRNVIESKWTSLEAPAVTSVTSLLQAASRPVLLRLTNAQKHAHAQSALNAVANRLRSKIGRGLPFPPATTSARREDEFDFERTISGVQALESALDPLLHSVELLRREKERAQRELEVEYKVLRRLGANARAEARERRERGRKMHVLVPEPVAREGADGGDKENVGVVLGLVGGGAGEEKGKVFADLQGEELLSLAGQIASHMESMRGNLQQVEGVTPAIQRSQGLLRAALQKRLDREQLESVILG